MKYDLNRKPTKFVERVFADLYTTLFDLLQKKSLESITVNEICESANYPRATFYNYFDDYADIKPKERTTVLFKSAYDYLDKKRPVIVSIMKHNQCNGVFAYSIRKTIRDYIYKIIVSVPCSQKYKLPYEMIAEHYGK